MIFLVWSIFFEWDIPLTDLAGRAIRAAWTANRTLSRAFDYPRTSEEMALWFRDDAAYQSYIQRLRWPGGFICPHCGVGVHLQLQPLTGTGLLFHRLAEQAVAVAPAPYRAITGKLANPADSEGSGQ